MARLTLCLWGLVAAAFVGIGGCTNIALKEQVTTFEVAHQPASGLKVTTRNGAVAVQRSSIDQVTVTARLAMASEARLEGTTISARRNEDGTLEIVAEPPDGRWRSREGCSFEILVPDAAGVEIRTGNGRIETSGLSGPATLSTSNGRIIVSGHDGDIEATTSNGRVRLDAFTGAANVRTSNGAVSLSPAAGCPGPLNVRTSNGAVTIVVPMKGSGPAFAGQLDMRTSNGAISVAEGVEARLHHSARRAATVSLGEGGESSVVRTSNGAIRLQAASPVEAETGS